MYYASYISYISDLIANSMIHTVLHSKLLLMKLKLLWKYYAQVHTICHGWILMVSKIALLCLILEFMLLLYAIKETQVNIKPSSILPDTKLNFYVCFDFTRKLCKHYQMTVMIIKFYLSVHRHTQHL